MSPLEFTSLDLPGPVRRGITDAGFVVATPIQEAALPLALRGKDVAGHYDELDAVYREIWGEHVHHGLWRTGRESVAEATHALADLSFAVALAGDCRAGRVASHVPTTATPASSKGMR